MLIAIYLPLKEDLPKKMAAQYGYKLQTSFSYILILWKPLL